MRQHTLSRFWLGVGITYVILIFPCAGQAPQSGQKVLAVENQKSHKQLNLLTGTKLRYKVAGSKTFESGRLLTFNDSVVTFENKKLESFSYPFQDVLVLKVPGSSDKRIIGTTLIILGTASIIIGTVGSAYSGASGSEDKGGLVAVAAGFVAVAGGIVLKQRTKVDLHKSWKFKGDTLKTEVEPLQTKDTGFKLRVGLGAGTNIAGKSTPLLFVEPAYQSNANLSFGLKIEGMYGGDDLKGANFTINGQYYLGVGKVRPFIGAGLGMYIMDGDGRFGFYPRFGAEWQRMSLTFDYNFVTAAPQTYYVGPVSGGYGTGSTVYYPPTSTPSSEMTKFLGIRLGYTIGGPAR